MLNAAPLKQMLPDPKLQIYHDLLLKWQAKINLVSPSTLDTAWERHFTDSLQLQDCIPAGTKTLADIGSGAGFPGLVLAIVRPELEVHLIESDQKKCSFLKAVSRETDTPVVIHTNRVESVSRETGFVPEAVTARALAALVQLIDYVYPWVRANPALTLICPKGENADAELEKATEKYSFSLQKRPSQTDSKGQILIINDIKLCA